MDLGLKGATAVVVGGGRGMGFATARCLAQDGARVAVIGRTKDVLERAAKGLTECGSPDALGLVADTTDAGQVQRVFDELSERWDGELNALVNAVGPGTRGTFEDLTDEQWREAFDDGVMGMVHCVRSALPLLRKAQWARIVNFSAHSTQRQTVILPAYTAAKAALTSISKNLSLLLAKDEIMVNLVSPGSIASEALRGWAE
jgi:3-oxoacyl-[acyl-carrier protein] reductase